MARIDEDRLNNTKAQRPLSSGPKRNRRSSVTGRRIHEAKSTGPSVGLVALILACVVAIVVTVAIVNRPPATSDATPQTAENTSKSEQKTAEESSKESATTEKSEDKKAKSSTTDTKSVSAGETAATSNKPDTSTETAKIGNDYNADKNKDENAEGEGKKGESEDSQNSGDDASSKEGEGENSSTTDEDSSGDGESTSSKSIANGEWIEAEACASSAAETGSGPTASGIDFDDSTPQVALQRSADSASHFGGYVEVRYGDQTARAQVVDHGGLHSGENGILLNPGVFEVFGATSSDDWGRREVSYRFV